MSALEQRTVCRSCQAEVQWVRTENGNRMPVDVDPHPDGNLEVVLGVARVVAPDPQLRGRYLSHFVTCPQAPEWRRR